ncbi:MAG TPA: ABC transporter permease [Candidatus Limnocylindria bacterium]|nr:ABC transporter permease [Candidatus Limnocylindria bacterium]
MEGWPRVLGATFLRDMWTATSYRAGFILSIGGSLASILSVFFIGQAFGASVSPSLDQYGGSYFAFAVVGVAFSGLLGLGLSGISSRIREGQMMGTLELMLLSPNRLLVLLIGASLWSHAMAIFSLVIYLLVGLALGLDLGQANVPMMLLSLAVSVIAFNGLGLLAASVVIVIKQGNPVSLIVGMASVLLAGVFYPVSVLPGWLQVLAQLLPLTHALELVRRSALTGEGIETLSGHLLALVALSVILVPLGLWACHRAVTFAQTDGSLSQY